MNDEHRLSLRDLLTEEANLLSAIIELDGEILPEIEAAIIASEYEIQHKIDNYARVMERLELEVEFRCRRAEREKVIQKRCEAIIERMKESIKQSMLRYQKKELRGYEVRYSISPSKPRITLRPDIPLSMVPPTLKLTKVEESLNKDLILRTRESDPVRMETMFNFEPSFSLRKYANTKSKKEIQDDLSENGAEGTKVPL